MTENSGFLTAALRRFGMTGDEVVASMKKGKPKIIKDAKARGEWAESVFMERAAGLGLTVSKPWGESSSFDLVVGSPGRFVGVQVKSTVCESGGGYECCIRGRQQKAYARGSFDFLAAYVVPEDVWYIIPAESVRGKETVCLCSDSKYAKYEEYREAWELLREAQGERERESLVTKVEVEEPVGPSGGVAGRMEASFNFMKKALERGVGAAGERMIAELESKSPPSRKERGKGGATSNDK